MSKIYFGGSRHPQNINHSLIAQVVGAVVSSGSSVHVGCQFGADQTIVSYVGFFAPSQLRVFAVASCKAQAPRHIQQAPQKQVTFSAGGSSSVPIRARYLLRSLAALHGCSAAVFFSPGSGSLAVASHAVAASIPVYAFATSAPGAPAGCAGQWVPSSFAGFACWQWSPAQISMF